MGFRKLQEVSKRFQWGFNGVAGDPQGISGCFRVFTFYEPFRAVQSVSVLLQGVLEVFHKRFVVVCGKAHVKFPLISQKPTKFSS